MIARAPLVAAALLVLAVLDIVVAGRPEPGAELAVALPMILPIALLARSAWPAVAGCVIGLVVAALTGIDDLRAPEVIALQVTSFGLADRFERRAAAVAAFLVAASLCLHLLIVGDPNDIPWVLGAFFAPFVVVGRLVRERRTRIAELRAVQAALAAERDHVARLAAEAERARIAWDIEAVLAATVRSIHDELDRAPDPPTPETFEKLHGRASEAMTELRRLLGVLGSGRGALLSESPAYDAEAAALPS